MDFSFLDDWEDEGAEPIEEAVGEGYRNIAVIAETAAGALLPDSLAALGQAREMADMIGVYVYAFLLGDELGDLADELIANGADKVLVAKDPALAAYRPGLYVAVLAELSTSTGPRSCCWRPPPWATTWPLAWPSAWTRA